MPHGLDGIAEGRGLSSPFFLYSLVLMGRGAKLSDHKSSQCALAWRSSSLGLTM